MPWRSDEVFRPPLKRRMQMKFFRVALQPLRAHAGADAARSTTPRSSRSARREWVALHTPGHTNDHLCLFDAADGIVLTGDHVLPTITPHISGLVAGADPLNEFFKSLDKVAGLDGRAAWRSPPTATRSTTSPAGPTTSATTTASGSTPSAAAAKELGDATVEEYSHKLFQPRSWGQMAESETYAHLEHLRQTGEVTSHDEAGTLHYTLVE